MSTILVYDATHANIRHLPPGARAAGYTTGSADIRWTAADWQAHPGAVRIDQDPSAGDPTADVLDVERGAASPADCPGWVKAARASIAARTRPGQRTPVIYASRYAITSVVNALTAGGVKSGAGLWIADWNKTRLQATTEVRAAAGPYPVAGVQYTNAGLYDVSVFDAAWIGPPGGPDWTREAIMSLPTLKQGAADMPGRTWHVRRAQALTAGTGRWNSLKTAAAVIDDGVFGPATTAGVKVIQAHYGITADGIVGPATWAKLIGA